MERQIALLRGINVGGHNRIAMAALRGWLEDLGHTEVRTHLQSGNVIFTSRESPEKAARDIEEVIHRQLGLDLRVLVRTRDELAAVVARDPFGEIATDPARYLVTFLAETPDPAGIDDLGPASFAPDAFHVEGREVYVWCPEGVRHTKLTHAFWQRRTGFAATARNWNTVTRLLSLADG